MTRYGRKITDGLRAYQEARRTGEFADAILERMGYEPKVAASIIDRLARADLIEWGVSARSGWLTDRGRAALEGDTRE